MSFLSLIELVEILIHILSSLFNRLKKIRIDLTDIK